MGASTIRARDDQRAHSYIKESYGAPCLSLCAKTQSSSKSPNPQEKRRDGQSMFFVSAFDRTDAQYGTNRQATRLRY